jgi:hypothetical protein
MLLGGVLGGHGIVPDGVMAVAAAGGVFGGRLWRGICDGQVGAGEELAGVCEPLG